jgi:hypothetical protein
VSAEFKVGKGGSEHVLAGHVKLSPLGALYLHAERHGTFLRRRLNPKGYNSRVTGISAHNGRLYWSLWARRDGWSKTDPKWQKGSLEINPLELLVGPKRYKYQNVGDRVAAVVRTPHGDDHEVSLQLQRQSFGRDRRRKRELSWTVDWDANPGIPTKPGDRGRVTGSAVAVTDGDVKTGTWAIAACAGIASRMTEQRTRYGYQPLEEPIASDA